MKYIGAHVSAAGGISLAPHNAQKIGARSFALFTRNQRSWHSPPLKSEQVTRFREALLEINIAPHLVMPHDSYLINVGSPKEEVRKKSIVALLNEVQRADQIGVLGVNFHPGAHLKMISVEQCIELIVDAMNDIIAQTTQALLIIENTAGQGSTIGRSFEEIASIINQVKEKSRVGVCLDTCHLLASGFDIRSPEGWQKTMQEFEGIIGLKYLKGIHLNDSKGALGSNVDRHNNIGMGELGWSTFKHIMQDPRLDNMPLILETVDDELWPQEIAQLNKLAERDNTLSDR